MRQSGPIAVAMRESDNPCAAPELPQGVDRHQPRGDGRAHGRTLRAEGRNRPEAADEDDVQHEIQPVIAMPSIIGVRASPADRSAALSMKNIIMPPMNTNMMRRNGSASALTAGAAFTKSSSHGDAK